MSPHNAVDGRAEDRFPRVSGDEREAPYRSWWGPRFPRVSGDEP